MSHQIINQGVGVADWSNPINSSSEASAQSLELVITFVAVGDPT